MRIHSLGSRLDRTGRLFFWGGSRLLDQTNEGLGVRLVRCPLRLTIAPNHLEAGGALLMVFFLHLLSPPTTPTTTTAAITTFHHHSTKGCRLQIPDPGLRHEDQVRSAGQERDGLDTGHSRHPGMGIYIQEQTDGSSYCLRYCQEDAISPSHHTRR